jgi:alcohol dehydrogenase
MVGSAVKALTLTATNRVEFLEVPIPELTDPHSLRVRVIATSICGSDLHLAAGHLTPEIGFALGHEWVGIVDEVGANVRSFTVGDRVVGPAAVWCGSCELCSRGQEQRCAEGGVFGSGKGMGNLGGAQSEYLIAPWAENTVVRVPEGVSDAQALSVGDVLSTGWTAVRQVVSENATDLLVIGCGPVGLSAIHTASAAGVAKIVGVDRLPARLEAARQLGATHTVLAGDDVLTELRQVLPGRTLSVIDAVGTQESLDLACSLAGIGARIAVLGIPSHALTVDMAGLLMRNVTLWTGLGDLGHMSELLEKIARGELDPTPMFSHTVTLAEVPAYYELLAAGDPSIVKVFVSMS